MPDFGLADGPAGSEAQPVATPLTPEQQLLNALAGATAGVPIVTETGIRAVPEAAYSAASGRSCRWVSVTFPGVAPERRLACGGQEGWHWAPSVMVQGDQ